MYRKTLTLSLLIFSFFAWHVRFVEAGTKFPPVRLRDFRYEMNDPCELSFEVPGDYVITAMGMRAAEGRVTTLWVTIREILPNGSLGEFRHLRRGSAPDHHPEGIVMLPEGYAAVGFGIQIIPWWDIGVLSLWGARFNRDGTLGDPIEFRHGFTPGAKTQMQILLPPDRVLTGFGVGSRDHEAVGLMAQSATATIYDDPPIIHSGLYLTDYRLEPSERHRITYFAPRGNVVTGIGMRAAEAHITSMQAVSQELRPDGTLGEAVHDGRGWLPWHEPEGHPLGLPEGYVAVGIGLSIQTYADIRTVMFWASPILEDGTLGEPEEFHAGFHPDPGATLQRQILLEPGRVLTGFGFWTDADQVLGMMVESARLAKAE